MVTLMLVLVLVLLVLIGTAQLVIVGQLHKMEMDILRIDNKIPSKGLKR